MRCRLSVAAVTPVMPRADWTLMAFVPLANSASVVNVCSTSRLAESPCSGRLVLGHVGPLIVTNWQSVALEPPKLSDLRAVSAVHADGTGVDEQFNAAC